ncbi:hypothetical protein HYR99_15725 [Candidatus Poribacteria bacterium]|nr:hypothetical protein [Candidatus Poribacteria bacterium]
MPRHLRDWGKAHLIAPRRITFYPNLETSDMDSCWLVTDHTGVQDAGYRVIYDEALDMFGLITELHDGRVYCLGFYGGFAETIESM